ARLGPCRGERRWTDPLPAKRTRPERGSRPEMARNNVELLAQAVDHPVDAVDSPVSSTSAHLLRLVGTRSAAGAGSPRSLAVLASHCSLVSSGGLSISTRNIMGLYSSRGWRCLGPASLLVRAQLG